jgi:hypothetical protein
VSHTPIPPGGDAHSALITTLGSDFRHAIAPYKAEILDLAHYLRGDLHRAAMRLLLEYRGRRPSVMEQQLIIAALAELQSGIGSGTGFAAATARAGAFSTDRRQMAPL